MNDERCQQHFENLLNERNEYKLEGAGMMETPNVT